MTETKISYGTTSRLKRLDVLGKNISKDNIEGRINMLIDFYEEHMEIKTKLPYETRVDSRFPDEWGVKVGEGIKIRTLWKE